ncbi:MAG: carboxypeptidase regulatory-like domain-containing protein [Chloroflexi bacterium]|nr:carboxypeptidase regulatory-like domain-containing protein [Chloroflexota bacterium]
MEQQRSPGRGQGAEGSGVPPLVLVELAEGHLDDADVEAIGAWIATEGLPATSEASDEKARRMGDAWDAPDEAGPLDGLRRVLAALVYDTRAQALPVGVRAVSQRSRSLLFAAEDFEITLQVSAGGKAEHLKVLGQVLLEGMPVAAVAARLDGPGGQLDTSTDDEGEFRLLDVPVGSYSMEIITADQVVECAPVDFRN